jgi:hypothetical protein
VTTGSESGDLLWGLAVGLTILVAVVLNLRRLRSVLRDRSDRDADDPGGRHGAGGGPGEERRPRPDGEV